MRLQMGETVVALSENDWSHVENIIGYIVSSVVIIAMLFFFFTRD